MRTRPAAGAWATGGSGAGLALVALAIGAPPLLVAGIGLLLLALAAPATAWPAAGQVTVTRRLVRRRVEEGEPIVAGLRITRGRGARVEVHEPLAGPRPLVVPPGRAVELSLAGPPRPRGRHRLAAPTALVSDPLGLCRFSRGGEAPDTDVLVLPRIEPVRWLRGGPGTGEPAAEATARRGAGGLGTGDFDTLRPYQHGTPPARIHWASLARGAGLQERRLRPAGEGWPLLVLDPRGAPDSVTLDAVVRAAASLAAELARRGGVRLVLPGERRPRTIGRDLAGWPAAHARLALLDGEAGPPPLPGGLGQVVFVAVLPPAGLPTAHETVLVLPGGAAAPRGRPVLAVGACRGYELAHARPRRVAVGA